MISEFEVDMCEVLQSGRALCEYSRAYSNEGPFYNERPLYHSPHYTVTINADQHFTGEPAHNYWKN